MVKIKYRGLSPILCLALFIGAILAPQYSYSDHISDHIIDPVVSHTGMIRVPYELVRIPIKTEAGELEKNRDVLNIEEKKELEQVFTPDEMNRYLAEPAFTYYWRFASAERLSRFGVNIEAPMPELEQQILAARNTGIIFQVRLWDKSGLDELAQILNRVETDIANFIEPQSKAFGTLMGLFVGAYAVHLTNQQMDGADGMISGVTDIATGTLSSLLLNGSLSLVGTDNLSLVPVGLSPLSMIPGGLKKLSGSQVLGKETRFPLLATTGFSAFNIGMNAGKSFAKILLSVPFMEDRKNIRVARSLLKRMVVSSSNGEVLVLDQNLVQQFSQAVGKYVSLAPNQGPQGNIVFGRSIYEIYRERCSRFDGNSNAVLTRRYLEGKPHYFLDIIDSNYELCRPLWDKVKISNATLRCKDCSRSLFEIEVFGVRVPSVGALVSPFITATIGILNSAGYPVQYLNTRKNMARKSGFINKVMGSGGSGEVVIDPEQNGYIQLEMTDVLRDDKIRKEIEKGKNIFFVEIDMVRERSDELKKEILERYDGLVESQLTALDNSQSVSEEVLAETIDLSRSEKVDKIIERDNRKKNYLRFRMQRDVVMTLNSILVQ